MLCAGIDLRICSNLGQYSLCLVKIICRRGSHCLCSLTDTLWGVWRLFSRFKMRTRSFEQLTNLYFLVWINIETLHICLSCFLSSCRRMYIPTHRMNTSASYTGLFGTRKRSGHEHSGVCIVFKQGLLNCRVRNENSEGLQCRFLFILCFQNICISVWNNIMAIY